MGGGGGERLADRLPHSLRPAHRLQAGRSAGAGGEHRAGSDRAAVAPLGVVAPDAGGAAVAVELDQPSRLAVLRRRDRKEGAAGRGVHADHRQVGRAVADRRRGARRHGSEGEGRGGRHRRHGQAVRKPVRGVVAAHRASSFFVLRASPGRTAGRYASAARLRTVRTQCLPPIDLIRAMRSSASRSAAM